jgi:hypothetical protein
MKGQDVLILLALAARPERKWTFPDLAHALRLSASEAHAAVKRLEEAGLVDPSDRAIRVSAAEEFLVHGLKYVFPCAPGARGPGVPTAHSAEPLAQKIVAASDDAYVWPHPSGTHRGLAIPPIYRSAPEAALADPELHEWLALVDAIRVGRARERNMAVAELTKRLHRAVAKS